MRSGIAPELVDFSFHQRRPVFHRWVAGRFEGENQLGPGDRDYFAFNVPMVESVVDVLGLE